MSDDAKGRYNRNSREITQGDNRAPNRAMLRAVGFKDGDFGKPIVGVANGQSDITPCNAGLGVLSSGAADAIREAKSGRTTLSPEAADDLVGANAVSAQFGQELTDREREVLVFLAILLAGFVYCWVKGDLDWIKSVGAQRLNQRTLAQTQRALDPAPAAQDVDGPAPVGAGAGAGGALAAPESDV